MSVDLNGNPVGEDRIERVSDGLADKIRGLDVTIVTKSNSKEGTLELLKEFNFPLENKKN